MPRVRLGVVLHDEALPRHAHPNDPVDVVVLRSTFLNPLDAVAAKRLGEQIHQAHPNAEIVPYAWHYLSFEATDQVKVAGNRSLDAQGQLYGHFRSTPPVEQAWDVSKTCAEALGATRLIVRTPPSFSPGSLARTRLSKFVETHPEPKLIWEPDGLWSSDAAAAFGEPLGLEVMAAAFALPGHLMELEGASWVRISGGRDGELRPDHAEAVLYALAQVGMFGEEDDEADDEADDDEREDEGVDEGPEETITLLFDGVLAYANLRAFVRVCGLI